MASAKPLLEAPAAVEENPCRSDTRTAEISRRVSISDLARDHREPIVGGRGRVHMRDAAIRVLRLQFNRRQISPVVDESRTPRDFTSFRSFTNRFDSVRSLTSNVSALATNFEPLSMGAVLSMTRPALVALLVLMLYALVGVLFFHYSSLQLSWVSAFYLAATTATTVGYGDLNPLLPRPNCTSDGPAYEPTQMMLLGTAAYIAGGVCTIGVSLGLLMQVVLDEERLLVCRRHGLALQLAQVGALEGWGWVEAVYWAVVTVSTVGYGGAVPTSEGARLFAALYMLVGVAATGRLLSDLAAWPLAKWRKRAKAKVLHQYGDTLSEGALWDLAASPEMRHLQLDRGADASGDAGEGSRAGTPRAYVSRDAFCLALLVRMGTVTPSELTAVQAAFDRLDVDGSGRLDMFDVHAGQLRHAHAARERARAEADAHAHAEAERRARSWTMRAKRWLHALTAGVPTRRARFGHVDGTKPEDEGSWASVSATPARASPADPQPAAEVPPAGTPPAGTPAEMPPADGDTSSTDATCRSHFTQESALTSSM